MRARHNIADCVGKRFGQITVIGIGSLDSDRKSRLICKCDCGTTKEMNARFIRQGQTISCGCLRVTRLAPTITHGQSLSLTYPSYRAMIRRCHVPHSVDYTNYGARGVTVCTRWRDSIEAFLSDMGERPSKAHSIDRIDNNGNYEPGNCRWATRSQQLSNRRVTRFVTAFGVRLPLSEWVKKTGISHAAISGRLRLGWSAEDAVTLPLKKKQARQ